MMPSSEMQARKHEPFARAVDDEEAAQGGGNVGSGDTATRTPLRTARLPLGHWVLQPDAEGRAWHH